MNPRLYRVIAGFLSALVLVSLAPRAPEMLDAVTAYASWATTWAFITNLQLPHLDLATVKMSAMSLWQSALSVVPAAVLVQGDGVLPLAGAAAFTLVLVVCLTRRHVITRAHRPEPAVRHARGLAVARASDRIMARPRKDDSLGARIRQAAEHGDGTPALARQFGVSLDAIRVATGRPPVITAAPPAKSLRFRPRASVELPAGRHALPKRMTSRAHG